MTNYALRYVGTDSLPSRLSDFDLQQYFRLSNNIQALAQRFRADRRAGAAIQLLCLHLFGSRFALSIRDSGDTKLYAPGSGQDYHALRTMIGGSLNIKHLRGHWDDILRLASSIKQGTVTASLMLRKLGSYPGRGGSLSVNC